jgi:type IV secretory pathway TraG/TraD family ATPase VirD4
LSTATEECAKLGQRKVHQSAGPRRSQLEQATVFQDLAQIRATYGHDQAKTIVSNHFAQVFLGASSDPDTLEHAARIIGEAQEEQTSMPADSGGRSSTTKGTRTRQSLPPDALRRLPRGTAVLLYRDLPAALVRLRPWYLEGARRERPDGRPLGRESSASRARRSGSCLG